MEKMLDLLENLDYLYLPQTILQSVWHADWTSAYRRDGIKGLCTELLNSLFGINSHQFYVPFNSGWSGRSIHQLLARFGVAMWGWSFANGEMFFRVKKKQAAWAQYVMLREGVPLQGPLLGEMRHADRHTGIARDRQQPCHSPDCSATHPRDLDSIVNSILEALGLPL